MRAYAVLRHVSLTLGLFLAACSGEDVAPSTVQPVATVGAAGASTPPAGSVGVAGAAGLPSAAPAAARPLDMTASTTPPTAAGAASPQPSAAPPTAGASAGAPPAAGAGGAAAPVAEAGSGGTPAPAPSTGPLFPAPGATNVCADVTLRLRLPSAPSLGTSGKISVFSSRGGNAVAVVDMAAAQVRETVGGTALTLPRPVHVSEREVIVRLPRRLDYGQEYYVTVDASAIKPAMELTDPSKWRFTTRAAAPADPSKLRVALDGSGDFCSVQGALDAVPARSKSEISIGEGTYFEAVHVSGKANVTLRGGDRKRTRIVGTNNENLNSGTAKRALVSFDNSQNIVIENLTIHNLTPQGGSQAEALRLDKCDQCVVRRADILSLQDTLLWTGRVYAKDCYIEGNVDFVWGYGAAYFDHCEIKTVGRTGYVVQARNGAGASGYVFVDSKITADPGISKIVLARIDAAEYPASQVAYVNCQMGSHIAPEGWTVTGGGGGSLRFWEYQSTNESGAPLDVSRRHAASKQISADQAATLRDPAKVLGGWAPPP